VAWLPGQSSAVRLLPARGTTNRARIITPPDRRAAGGASGFGTGTAGSFAAYVSVTDTPAQLCINQTGIPRFGMPVFFLSAALSSELNSCKIQLFIHGEAHLT
jgi:hypothetical protein